jgi:hypothetical protein
VIAMTTSVTTDETIGAMIDVAKTTTTATTTIEKSGVHHHRPKGQPQWCVPVSQLRDQLHRWWSPSDPKQ